MFGQTSSRLTAEGEADGPLGVCEAVGGAGVGRDQAGQTFTEDNPWTVGLGTPETAEAETQGEEALLAGEVCDGTAVMAVDAVGARAAAGAGGGRGAGAEVGDSEVGGEDKVVKAQAEAARQWVEQEKHGSYSKETGSSSTTGILSFYRAAAPKVRENPFLMPITKRERRASARRQDDQGSRWLRQMLTQAAWAASRTKDTYLSAQYRRLAAQTGQEAGGLVALGHTLLVIMYHLLRKRTTYQELGGDFLERLEPDRLTRQLVQRLEKLGHDVTLRPKRMPLDWLFSG